MCALRNQDQGVIELSQFDYLPILIDSFLMPCLLNGALYPHLCKQEL